MPFAETWTRSYRSLPRLPDPFGRSFSVRGTQNKQRKQVLILRNIFVYLSVFMLACISLSPALPGALAEDAGVTPFVRAGGSFGYAVSSDGKIWGWGDNGKGQLGTGDTKRVKTPSPAALGLDGSEILDIACGNVASLFLMRDGTVWSVGNNNYGQQGQGKDAPAIMKEPVQVKGLENVVQVSSGFGQCMALTGDGSVYVWGRNDYGQLGLGDRKARNEPEKLDLQHVTYVCCGGKFSMAMDENGDIWGWGDNEHGQLLEASKRKRVLTPTKLSISGRFVQIACGGDHALGIDGDGRLWAWGRNDYYQLGTKTKGKIVEEPIAVTFPEGYENVRIARVYAYNSHTAAVSENGALWVWGSVYHGQMGNGVTASKSLPMEPCPAEGVVEADVGSLQTYALLEDGSLMGCGCNEYSQTGAFKWKADYYVRSWKDTGLNLMTGTWQDPGND